MGNNLYAYRATIGLFHACKMSLNIGYDSRSDTFHDILITNLRCSFLFASLFSEHYQIPLISFLNIEHTWFVLYSWRRTNEAKRQNSSRGRTRIHVNERQKGYIHRTGLKPIHALSTGKPFCTGKLHCYNVKTNTTPWCQDPT